MPHELRLAFDKSARHVDADGRLHIERSHISKANICAYYGKEIPGWENLGLKADAVYKLFRDPVELERGAATFARLPILREHTPVTVDSPQAELVIGAIGSDIAFNAPYLDADLCFWDAQAIAGIEHKVITELSCAYRYVPVMEPGEYEGLAYDGKMTEIKGNHLALVEVGRAGSDVVVADENPFQPSTKEITVKMTKMGKALFAAICMASPTLAQDSAVPALVGNANRKSFKPAEVKAKLMALDAAIDSEKLDSVLDAILDVSNDPEPTAPATATDEGPADKVRAMLSGKVDDETIAAIVALMTPAAATDEEPDDKADKKDVAAAMDALRVEFREAAEAAREVRPVVGDVIGMDKAADIYAFALDHMKVDRKDVEGVPALRAMFKIASSQKDAPVKPVRLATDSAALAEQFPGLARIRNA